MTVTYNGDTKADDGGLILHGQFPREVDLQLVGIRKELVSQSVPFLRDGTDLVTLHIFQL